jgi:hypothetical protein
MNASKNATSRRHFLKTTSGVAAGSALAGAAMPMGCCSTPPAPSPTPLPHNPREALTEKLGEIVSQPNSAFKAIQVRMPGWRADTQSNGAIKFFQEEAVHGVSGVLEYFPPPRFPTPDNPAGEYFAEPKQPAQPTDWNTFNKWMLGVLLPDPAVAPFDKFLTELAARVRRYNAALYWMRRLHFREHAPSSQQLPRNPSGDQDGGNPLPDPITNRDDFATLVQGAITAWTGAADKLNNLLAGLESTVYDQGFKTTMADMVEVNGYIVSMRVVSSPSSVPPPGHEQSKEMGGSSSSHISISSAFKSS